MARLSREYILLKEQTVTISGCLQYDGVDQQVVIIYLFHPCVTALCIWAHMFDSIDFLKMYITLSSGLQESEGLKLRVSF